MSLSSNAQKWVETKTTFHISYNIKRRRKKSILQTHLKNCRIDLSLYKFSAIDNTIDNIIHPNKKYPTTLVGPTSSGSCHKKEEILRSQE